MINMLIWVKIFKSALLEQASPDDVAASSYEVAEASHLEGVDDAVVDMSRFRHLEGK